MISVCNATRMSYGINTGHEELSGFHYYVFTSVTTVNVEICHTASSVFFFLTVLYYQCLLNHTCSREEVGLGDND